MNQLFNGSVWQLGALFSFNEMVYLFIGAMKTSLSFTTRKSNFSYKTNAKVSIWMKVLRTRDSLSCWILGGICWKSSFMKLIWTRQFRKSRMFRYIDVYWHFDTDKLAESYLFIERSLGSTPNSSLSLWIVRETRYI